MIIHRLALTQGGGDLDRLLDLNLTLYGILVRAPRAVQHI
jgi:hypothetical protein